MKHLYSLLLLPFVFACTNMGMHDRTVHSQMFVDHLNNMPSGKSSYLLWHNPSTGNKGDQSPLAYSYIQLLPDGTEGVQHLRV